MKIEAKIPEVGKIYKIDTPFDQAVKNKPSKSRLITGRDLAYSRILRGKNHSLSTNGSFIREGVAYPDEMRDKTLLIRESLLLNPKIAEQAVKAHRQGSEYFNEELIATYIKMAEEDKAKPLEKRRVLIVDKRGTYEIPVEKIPNTDETKWILLDQAEPYAEFLNGSGISAMPVYLSSSRQGNFANQLWLCDLVNWSGLDGSGGDLNCGYRSRWVLERGAEGAAPRKSRGKTKVLPYTKTDLINARTDLKNLKRILRPEQIKNLENLISKL